MSGQPNLRPFGRIDLLGCPVDRVTIPQCLAWFEKVIAEGSRCHIVVINAAKVVKARRDPRLAEVIHAADLVGADGMSIVWASHLLGRPLPGRVNGTDLMEALFGLAAKKDYRVFLLGARQRVIEQAVARLRRDYPSLNITGYRNGYFKDEADEQEAVQAINAARPDILLLGMSTPMKELWVGRHKELLSVPVIHGVGGSFDIVGGVTRRAPRWMQRAGLEWFYRLIQEPRRLGRRYLITNTQFIWLVLQAAVKNLLAGRKHEWGKKARLS